MSADNALDICLSAVWPSLREGESVVGIKLGEPESASHADYYRRYKIDLGFISGDGTQVSNMRCLVVRISSNTGEARISSESCAEVLDVKRV